MILVYFKYSDPHPKAQQQQGGLIKHLQSRSVGDLIRAGTSVRMIRKYPNASFVQRLRSHAEGLEGSLQGVADLLDLPASDSAQLAKLCKLLRLKMVEALFQSSVPCSEKCQRARELHNQPGCCTCFSPSMNP